MTPLRGQVIRMGKLLICALVRKYRTTHMFGKLLWGEECLWHDYSVEEMG